MDRATSGTIHRFTSHLPGQLVALRIDSGALGPSADHASGDDRDRRAWSEKNFEGRIPLIAETLTECVVPTFGRPDHEKDNVKNSCGRTEQVKKAHRCTGH